jgi:hypothetical protein
MDNILLKSTLFIVIFNTALITYLIVVTNVL